MPINPRAFGTTSGPTVGQGRPSGGGFARLAAMPSGETSEGLPPPGLFTQAAPADTTPPATTAGPGSAQAGSFEAAPMVQGGMGDLQGGLMGLMSQQQPTGAQTAIGSAKTALSGAGALGGLDRLAGLSEGAGLGGAASAFGSTLPFLQTGLKLAELLTASGPSHQEREAKETVTAADNVRNTLFGLADVSDAAGLSTYLQHLAASGTPVKVDLVGPGGETRKISGSATDTLALINSGWSIRPRVQAGIDASLQGPINDTVANAVSAVLNGLALQERGNGKPLADLRKQLGDARDQNTANLADQGDPTFRAQPGSTETGGTSAAGPALAGDVEGGVSGYSPQQAAIALSLMSMNPGLAGAMFSFLGLANQSPQAQAMLSEAAPLTQTQGGKQVPTVQLENPNTTLGKLAGFAGLHMGQFAPALSDQLDPEHDIVNPSGIGGFGPGGNLNSEDVALAATQAGNPAAGSPMSGGNFNNPDSTMFGGKAPTVEGPEIAMSTNPPQAPDAPNAPTAPDDGSGVGAYRKGGPIKKPGKPWPGRAAPSNGQGVDDVPIKAQAGEYMVPQGPFANLLLRRFGNTVSPGEQDQGATAIADQAPPPLRPMGGFDRLARRGGGPGGPR